MYANCQARVLQLQAKYTYNRKDKSAKPREIMLSSDKQAFPVAFAYSVARPFSIDLPRRTPYALHRISYTSDKFFHQGYFVWDASQMGSTALHCLVTSSACLLCVSVYTCAGKCGPSISLCIQKRGFRIASRLVIPTLAFLRPIEGGKKRKWTILPLPSKLFACPGDIHKLLAHCSC